MADLQKRDPFLASNAISDALATLKREALGGADPIAGARLGSLLLMQGRHRAATDFLRRSTLLLPNLPRPWLNLAIIDELEGNDKDGEIELRRALALDPADNEVWFQLAVSAGQAGLDAEAQD